MYYQDGCSITALVGVRQSSRTSTSSCLSTEVSVYVVPARHHLNDTLASGVDQLRRRAFASWDSGHIAVCLQLLDRIPFAAQMSDTILLRAKALLQSGDTATAERWLIETLSRHRDLASKASAFTLIGAALAALESYEQADQWFELSGVIKLDESSVADVAELAEVTGGPVYFGPRGSSRAW